MRSLLLTLMMLLISITLACASKMDQQTFDLVSKVNIDGKWAGVQGTSTISFEFQAEGDKLIGLSLGSGAGDERKVIENGKVKLSRNKGKEISFEVPVASGGSKRSLVYTGEVLDENRIELTIKTRQRGSRDVGFDGPVDGFGGGGGGGGGEYGSGFGGGGSSETKLVIKRVGNF